MMKNFDVSIISVYKAFPLITLLCTLPFFFINVVFCCTALDTFAAAISDMEGNYPEGLFRLFIVRAPGVFPMAFNMVKVHILLSSSEMYCVPISVTSTAIDAHSHCFPPISCFIFHMYEGFLATRNTKENCSSWQRLSKQTGRGIVLTQLKALNNVRGN